MSNFKYKVGDKVNFKNKPYIIEDTIYMGENMYRLITPELFNKAKFEDYFWTNEIAIKKWDKEILIQGNLFYDYEQ